MSRNQSSSAIVHFSGGSDSTYAAAVMAEKFETVHLVTYDRVTFIGAKDYSEKNYRRLCAVYGADKFIRRIVPINKLHKKVCYDKYIKNLRQHGVIVAALSFSKLAMFWSTAKYALANGITHVADGSVPYMELYPDQNPLIRDRLREFFDDLGLVYETPAYDKAAQIEDLLYAKGITTSARVRGTQNDLQVFYLEQVLLALYLKFHLTTFGQKHYDQAILRLYDSKLKDIQSRLG